MAHRVARRASADLDDIWYYVAKESASVEIANRLIDSITNRFFLLASHPHLGRSRDDDFGIGSRSFPVGGYLIVPIASSSSDWNSLKGADRVSEDAGRAAVHTQPASFRAMEQYKSTASLNCFFSTYSPSVWAT
jgi:plasmid stabilization system protein ParE